MTKAQKEFRSSQALRENLLQILQNTTLAHALEVIKSAPDEFPVQTPGIHYDLVLAREHAKTVGINSAVKALWDLTKEPSEKDEFQSEANRPEWMDNLPPEMVRMIEKAKQQQSAP